jgi:hypothetical protein
MAINCPYCGKEVSLFARLEKGERQRRELFTTTSTIETIQRKFSERRKSDYLQVNFAGLGAFYGWEAPMRQADKLQLQSGDKITFTYSISPDGRFKNIHNILKKETAQATLDPPANPMKDDENFESADELDVDEETL